MFGACCGVQNRKEFLSGIRRSRDEKGKGSLVCVGALCNLLGHVALAHSKIGPLVQRGLPAKQVGDCYTVI